MIIGNIEALIKPVEEKEIFWENGQKNIIENKKAIIHDKKAVGIVSDRYQLIPNEYLLDCLNEATEDLGIDITYTNILSHNTEKQFNAEFTVQEDLKIEDDSINNPIIELRNSYDGSMTWSLNVSGSITEKQLFFYVIRQVCSNGMRGKVRIDSIWDARENEEVFLGEGKLTTIEKTNIINLKHTINNFKTKEYIKKEISKGFGNNELVKRFIEKAYEKANSLLLNQLLEFMEKVNAKDFELANILIPKEAKGFVLVNLITNFLTNVLKQRSFDRYKKYQQYLWSKI